MNQVSRICLLTDVDHPDKLTKTRFRYPGSRGPFAKYNLGKKKKKISGTLSKVVEKKVTNRKKEIGS